MTEAVHPAEQRIFAIIRDSVCGECPASGRKECGRHRLRCYAGYERQAREIYRQVVQPLETKGHAVK